MTRPGVRDEDGFTLMELLVSMIIGTAVMLAALQLVDVSVRSSQRTDDRVASTQNGRNAMEQLVQELRSNVCLDDPAGVHAPIAAGDSTSVSFYAAMTNPSGVTTTAFQPDLRRVYYDAPTQSLIEQRSAGTGTYPALSFPTVTQTRVLANDVHPVPGVPMFSFFAYKADNTVDVVNDTPLGVPLTSTGLAATGVVRVAFSTGPGRASSYKGVDATFDEAVPLRLVDLTNAQAGPVCRI